MSLGFDLASKYIPKANLNSADQVRACAVVGEIIDELSHSTGRINNNNRDRKRRLKMGKGLIRVNAAPYDLRRRIRQSTNVSLLN